MGLVINFKTMQQPTILVIFFQITESIPNQDYRHSQSQSNFLLQLPVLFLLLLLLIARQLSNLIIKQVLQTDLQLVILKFSYLATLALSERKCIHSNVSQFIYVGSELIFIAQAFMHELDILSPRTLARFVIIQQLIYI